MSEFKSRLSQAWQDHGNDPRGVALRLPQLLGWVQTEQHIAEFTGLAHHVLGEHLAAWSEGLSVLEQLRKLPTFEVTGPSGQSVARAAASLRLSQGSADERPNMSLSDAVRVGAMAASNLALHDTPRAMQLTQEVLVCAAQASASGLPETDPLHRAVAVSCNNLAATLEELPQRSDEQRELMLQAAQGARVHWAIAGTWLETERAEYRLTLCWLKAGNATQAMFHARACLAIVEANGAVAFERFFAGEVLALAAKALGDKGAFSNALNIARNAFAALSDEDRSGCKATLDLLEAQAGGG